MLRFRYLLNNYRNISINYRYLLNNYRIISINNRYSTDQSSSLSRINSQWLDDDRMIGSNRLDIERQFTNPQVQQLLYKLIGGNVDKLFPSRRLHRHERTHYALMTTEQYESVREQMMIDGQQFLQMVPFVEGGDHTEVLAFDEEISGHDRSHIVFTDVSGEVDDLNRVVVVREPNGRLRTGNAEERCRMNRIFFPKKDRSPIPPPLFDVTSESLANALDNQKHVYVLDWACYYFDPDVPDFIKLVKHIYNHIFSTKQFDLLKDTRHYGGMVYFLIINKRIATLLDHYGERNDLTSAADVIRIYRLVHVNWRVSVKTTDSDETIVKTYLDERKHEWKKMPNLLKLIKQ